METTSPLVLSGANEVTTRYDVRVADMLTGSFLALLLVFVVLFPARFDDPVVLSQRLFIVLIGFAGVAATSRRIASDTWQAAARICLYASVLMYLFDEMQYFQGLLHSRWFDKDVLRFEEVFLGGNAVAMLQPLIQPWLTEGLMFTYVMYMPLLPVLAWVVFRSGGFPAVSDYLLTLSAIFLACFAGYILLPVASPMYHHPGEYTVPLTGGLWTWCGEWLRQNHHYPGGSIPSAHCAAATGMLLMLYRHCRRGFYVSIPIFIPLYAATVYCRYHYLTDAVTGILIGSLLVVLLPRVVAVLSRGYLSNEAYGPILGKKRISQHYTILTNDRPVGDSSAL